MIGMSNNNKLLIKTFEVWHLSNIFFLNENQMHDQAKFGCRLCNNMYSKNFFITRVLKHKIKIYLFRMKYINVKFLPCEKK